jgi:DNA repair exonuclease SbcCD ATPase subunit
LAERESEHKQVVDRLNSREANLLAKVNDLSKQLEVQSHELEKQKAYQNEYRKLLNDILVEKKRHSHMSQSSVDSYPASTAMTATKTELISDYGDHETLDKELALADSDDEEEPDHNFLIAELKSRLKDDSRLSIIDTVEHSRVVRDLRQELEEVRSAYEEDTSELQRTLNDVKTQLLSFSRLSSSSESSGSDATLPDKESTALKVQQLQRQIAKQREDHKEVIQLLDTAQTLATSREQKVNDLNATLNKLRTEYDTQSTTIVNLTTEFQSLKSANDELQNHLEEARQNATDLEKIANEAARLLESVTVERDSHLTNAKTLQTKLDEFTKKHNSSVKDMKAAHKEEVQNLKHDNSEYLTIIQHLKDQVSESETSISTHLLQITSIQQKLDALNKESREMKKAKMNADRDMKELRNEINVLTKQKQEAKDKLTEVSNILTQLQKDYDALKARKASADTEALVLEQAELIKALESRVNDLETRPNSADPTKRVRSGSMSGRWSNTTPTPPPAMPLPPLPGSLPVPPSPTSATFGRTTPTSRGLARTSSQDYIRPGSRDANRSPSESEMALARQVEEKDAKIVDLERQFRQERQLVQTLEEALSDTEKSMKQLKKQTNTLAADKEILHTKMLDVTHQLEMAQKEAMKNRESMQQLSEAKEQRAKVTNTSLDSCMETDCFRLNWRDDSWRRGWKKLPRGGDRSSHAFNPTFISRYLLYILIIILLFFWTWE